MITTKFIDLNIPQEIQDEEFPDENRDMHPRIAKALESSYGIRILAINTNVGGKFIDILGVDEKNNGLVIVECKTGQERGLFVQAISYAKIVCDNWETIEEIGEGKNLKIDPDYPIRLLCVAHRFEDHEINCYEVLRGEMSQERFRLEPVTYRWYRETNKIILSPLNPLEEGTKKTRSTAVRIPRGESTLDHHLDGKSLEIQELFKKVQKIMFGLSPKMEEVCKTDYINYRGEGQPNFAYVCIQNSKIKMTLRGEMEDSQKMLRDVSEVGNWGACKNELSIYPDSNLDYVTKLLTQAFGSTK